MKTWQRKSFSGYSEPIPTATYGYWYRLRGQVIAYVGAPITTPLLTNPKIHPAVKALWRIGYARRFAAWKLSQMDTSAGNGRQLKTVFEMAQQLDTPRFTQRAQEPSDWVKTAFPQGVAFMPARPPSTEADIVPHLQYAGISGGFAAAVLMMTMSSAVYLSDWPADWYLIAAALSLMIGTVYAWRQWEVSTARARVGWWAMEVARNEDIDGDGYIGEPIKPRAVPVNANGRTDYLNMETPGGLYASEWREVAIAVLVKHGRISRRGIAENSKLSQSKAMEAVAALEAGYANDDKTVNRAGYDFLIHYLPDHLSPTIPRPA